MGGVARVHPPHLPAVPGCALSICALHSHMLRMLIPGTRMEHKLCGRHRS